MWDQALFHDGRVESLGKTAGKNGNDGAGICIDMTTNTQLALTQLEVNRTANVAEVHQNVAFTDDDVSDLVAFLETLTDPCVKDRSCLAPWIPDAGDTNPDGLRVNAINNTGGFL
jgi:cytochrome c peroxidase